MEYKLSQATILLIQSYTFFIMNAIILYHLQ